MHHKCEDGVGFRGDQHILARQPETGTILAVIGRKLGLDQPREARRAPILGGDIGKRLVMDENANVFWIPIPHVFTLYHSKYLW